MHMGQLWTPKPASLSFLILYSYTNTRYTKRNKDNIIQLHSITICCIMRFFRNKKTALAAQEDQDEYVVEVQDNNAVYLGDSEKLHGTLEDNPTFDSEANTDALGDAVKDHDDQVDPFGIEMDVQTYKRQTRADVPEKSPQEEKFTVSPRSIRALLICALLVIALIITLFVSLSVTRGKSSAASTTTASPPTASPPTASPPTTTGGLTADEASAYIIKSLNFSTPEEIATASNVATPQGQAVSSLAVGEQLATTRTAPSRIQQRYALAVLYYSTSGSSNPWVDAEGWSTMATEECQWKGITCGSSGDNNTKSTTDESVAVTDLNLGKYILFQSVFVTDAGVDPLSPHATPTLLTHVLNLLLSLITISVASSSSNSP